MFRGRRHSSPRKISAASGIWRAATRLRGGWRIDLDAPDRAGIFEVHESCDDHSGGGGDIYAFIWQARETPRIESTALLSEVGPPIEQLLGDRIYSRKGESLEQVK